MSKNVIPASQRHVNLSVSAYDVLIRYMVRYDWKDFVLPSDALILFIDIDTI